MAAANKVSEFLADVIGKINILDTDSAGNADPAKSANEIATERAFQDLKFTIDKLGLSEDDSKLLLSKKADADAKAFLQDKIDHFGGSAGDKALVQTKVNEIFALNAAGKSTWNRDAYYLDKGNESKYKRMLGETGYAKYSSVLPGNAPGPGGPGTGADFGNMAGDLANDGVDFIKDKWQEFKHNPVPVGLGLVGTMIAWSALKKASGKEGIIQQCIMAPLLVIVAGFFITGGMSSAVSAVGHKLTEGHAERGAHPRSIPDARDRGDVERANPNF